MVRLGDRPKRSSLIKRDRECNLGKGIDRVEIDARDLCGVDVQSDVADGVLAQGWMFAAGADVDSDIEPLSPFDRVRCGDFRRMFRIEGFAQFLVLGGELLVLRSPYRSPHSTG